jgi:putative nucleotidyltransferase with HDIG domain
MLGHMTENLRRKILGRLLLVAVALAAIAGGAIFLLERRVIDQRIFSLALEESRGLATHLDFLSGPRGGDEEEVRRQVTAHLLAEHISEGHFVVIEIYDLARRKVVEAIHPAFTAVEKVVDVSHHGTGPADRLVHTWLSIDGISYVQVMAPLQVAGRTLAYFEGTFRVDPEAMEKMNRELAISVLLVVLVVLATAMALYPLMLRLNGDLLRLSDDLAYANMGMLAALGSAVARRDRGTNAHNYRVTIYAIHLAQALGLSSEAIRGLIKGAFLHDVGKIGIADAILRKPGRLTPEETEVMRAHVRYGVEIVGKFEWLKDALAVVGSHHERVDGKGYPAGLKGEEIPMAARIFAVVDVFDALTTRRPYKAPVPLEETMRHLEAGRGLSFDPRVLEAFAAVAPALHRSICGASELELARALDRLLVRYFPAPAGAHQDRAPLQLRTLAPAHTPAHGTSGLDYLSGAWSIDWPAESPEPAQEPFGDDPFRDALLREEVREEDPFKDVSRPDDPFRKKH